MSIIKSIVAEIKLEVEEFVFDCTFLVADVVDAVKLEVEELAFDVVHLF